MKTLWSSVLIFDNYEINLWYYIIYKNWVIRGKWFDEIVSLHIYTVSITKLWILIYCWFECLCIWLYDLKTVYGLFDYMLWSMLLIWIIIERSMGDRSTTITAVMDSIDQPIERGHGNPGFMILWLCSLELEGAEGNPLNVTRAHFTAPPSKVGSRPTLRLWIFWIHWFCYWVGLYTLDAYTQGVIEHDFLGKKHDIFWWWLYYIISWFLNLEIEYLKVSPFYSNYNGLISCLFTH